MSEPSPVETPSESKPSRARRAIALAALIVVLAWELAPIPRSAVEQLYSRSAYRWISAPPIALADLLPFSAGGALIAVAVFGTPFLLLRSWRARRRAGLGALRWSGIQLERALSIAVVGYLAFLVNWGAHYGRESIETQLGLDERSPDAAEVLSLAEWLADRVEADAIAEGRDVERALLAIRRSFDATLEAWWGESPPMPQRIKRTPPGLFLMFGTTGMLLPIFIEPHVDGALPDAEIVSVAAHEWAHAAGFAGEADAELAGIIAGLAAEDAFARYAVALGALRRCLGALEPADRERIEGRMPAIARGDIDAMRRVAKAWRSPHLSSLQSAFHDRFLKTRGVAAGVRDYERAVALLAKARRAGRVR